MILQVLLIPHNSPTTKINGPTASLLIWSSRQKMWASSCWKRRLCFRCATFFGGRLFGVTFFCQEVAGTKNIIPKPETRAFWSILGDSGSNCYNFAQVIKIGRDHDPSKNVGNFLKWNWHWEGGGIFTCSWHWPPQKEFVPKLKKSMAGCEQKLYIPILLAGEVNKDGWKAYTFPNKTRWYNHLYTWTEESAFFQPLHHGIPCQSNFSPTSHVPRSPHTRVSPESVPLSSLRCKTPKSAILKPPQRMQGVHELRSIRNFYHPGWLVSGVKP